MATNPPNVLGFLAAPSREDSLHAVSLALLRVRTSGIPYKEIAKACDVSPDTIENAALEKSLLSFDAIARLGYFWPDQFQIVAELWGRTCENPTIEDRLARIDRELAAIRKEAA